MKEVKLEAKRFWFCVYRWCHKLIEFWFVLRSFRRYYCFLLHMVSVSSVLMLVFGEFFILLGYNVLFLRLSYQLFWLLRSYMFAFVELEALLIIWHTFCWTSWEIGNRHILWISLGPNPNSSFFAIFFSCRIRGHIDKLTYILLNIIAIRQILWIYLDPNYISSFL